MLTSSKVWFSIAVLGGMLVVGEAAAEEPQYTSAFTTCLNASGGTTPGILDCIEVETKVWDKALNDAYKRTMSAIPQTRRTGLQAAQRAWIKFRDANCTFLNAPDGGQQAQVSANECVLRMTAERAKELASFSE